MSSPALVALRQAQVPLVALVLLTACAAKLVSALRSRSLRTVFGATGLFPARLRQTAGLAVCAVEAAIGVALIVTADASGAKADGARLAAALFFVVATTGLLELRERRPGMACGCFGDLSADPVGIRHVLRAALLACASASSVGAPPLQAPVSAGRALAGAGAAVVELALFAALSPELSRMLVRLGYSEPCEVRSVPADRVLASLRRSRAWRRHASLITADGPGDMWRELCWWYAVYPARDRARDLEVVFAIRVRPGRSAIKVALVVPASAPVGAGSGAYPAPGLTSADF